MGFTVTVTVNVDPVHEPDSGVTVYTTFIAAFVVFTNVPPILDAPLPSAVPVIPTTLGALQLYVVPAGTISVPFVGVTLKLPPLHIVDVLLIILATGSIVT